MQSIKTSSHGLRRGRRAPRRAYGAVRISSGLIAFYPRAIYRRQPYVILLDPASGILKRLDFQTTK